MPERMNPVRSLCIGTHGQNRRGGSYSHEPPAFLEGNKDYEWALDPPSRSRLSRLVIIGIVCNQLILFKDNPLPSISVGQVLVSCEPINLGLPGRRTKRGFLLPLVEPC